MVGRNIGMLLKSVDTRPVGMMMFYLRNIPEIVFSSKHLYWCWIGCSEKSVGSGFHISGGRGVVLLSRVPLEDVGT